MRSMPEILQEAKVRGRTAPAARSREPIADRSETQKPNHSHPRSGRLLYPPFGGRSPDENQSGTDEHVKRHVGPVRRKRQATCLREQTCEGLSENPKSAAGRVGEDRASGQAALARLADSGTPRGERTAAHDRSRAADAILAQSGMVGEPSSGYHGEPLAGLMTLPRIQRRLLPKTPPMWQHG
jgi:hypothetical protein